MGGSGSRARCGGLLAPWPRLFASFRVRLCCGPFRALPFDEFHCANSHIFWAVVRLPGSPASNACS